MLYNSGFRTRDVLRRRYRAIRHLLYFGAGLCFVRRGADGSPEVLLARRYSGIWSIPGGGRDQGEYYRRNAEREAEEEFCGKRRLDEILSAADWGASDPDSLPEFRVRLWPFFLWSTFLVRLTEVPADFPQTTHRGFVAEFCEAAWFPVKSLPPRSHVLLRLALWRLQRHLRSHHRLTDPTVKHDQNGDD